MSARRFVVFVGTAIAAVLVSPAASAQVPAIPPPVLDAIDQANAVAGPVLIQGADAAQPAVNAAGFALRPACVQGSTIGLALGLAGLPIKPWTVTKPYSAFCAGALRAGPADPVFYTVDDAAGPQLQSAVEPALVAVNPAVKQVRPNIAVACIAVALGNPSALPPPVSRFSVANEVCWR